MILSPQTINFLIFLCFSFIEAKKYYIGLNVSNESSCESLDICLRAMNETSIIYIVFNNRQIFLQEYISIKENFTIYNIGLNNELIFDNGFINGYKNSISFINISLIFKVSFFFPSPSISIEEGNLTFQVLFLFSFI